MIKRYELGGLHEITGMEADIDGEWVKYEDHVAEVQRIILARPLATAEVDAIGEVAGHETEGRALVDWYDGGLYPVGMKIYKAPSPEEKPTVPYRDMWAGGVGPMPDEDQLWTMVRVYHGWKTDDEMVAAVGYDLELYVAKMRKAVTAAISAFSPPLTNFSK